MAGNKIKCLLCSSNKTWWKYKTTAIKDISARSDANTREATRMKGMIGGAALNTCVREI